MFNLTDLVSDILLEVGEAGATPPPAGTTDNQSQQIPKWLQEILDKHKELFADIPAQRLNNLFIVANKRPRPSSAEIRDSIDAVRIVDIFRRLINVFPDPKPKTYTQFISGLSDANISAEGQNIIKQLNSLNPNTKYSWELQDTDIRNQYNIARSEADKEAAVALSTYNNQSILETTKQIVTKRTSVWDRIARLKSPTQPFSNLIVDIFRHPKDYMAGSKKVTNDFQEIVDSLYIQNLFKVGLAAKEFFKAEIGRLKLQASPDNTIKPGAEGEAAAANTAGVASMEDSLSLFNKYLNTVVINELGVIPTAIQGIKRGTKLLRQGERLAKDPRFRQKYEELKKKLDQDQANYDLFLQGKPIQYKVVDIESGQEKDTGTAGPYTVGSISKLETPEAVNLINALKAIAEYVRKGVGTGERLKYAGQAAGALAAFGGAKLYGN